MKKTITWIAILFVSFCIYAQNQELIWEESFNSYQIPSGIEGQNDGDTTTNAFIYLGDYNENFEKWTLDASNADLQNFTDYAIVHRVSGNTDAKLRVQDTGGTGISWITEEISLTGYESVGVNLFIEETGDHEPTDFIDIQFSVDNGANYTLVPNWNGFGDSNHTFIGTDNDISACLNDFDFRKQLVHFSVPDNASSLIVKVNFFNSNSSSENYFMDDVKVFGLPTTASINDFTNSNLEIHPNPSNGNNIEFRLNNGINHIQVYTIQGKLISEIKNINLQNYVLESNSISNGLYIVNVIDENENVYTKKLLIQN